MAASAVNVHRPLSSHTRIDLCSLSKSCANTSTEALCTETAISETRGFFAARVVTKNIASQEMVSFLEQSFSTCHRVSSFNCASCPNGLFSSHQYFYAVFSVCVLVCTYVVAQVVVGGGG